MWSVFDTPSTHCSHENGEDRTVVGNKQGQDTEAPIGALFVSHLFGLHGFTSFSRRLLINLSRCAPENRHKALYPIPVQPLRNPWLTSAGAIQMGDLALQSSMGTEHRPRQTHTQTKTIPDRVPVLCDTGLCLTLFAGLLVPLRNIPRYVR